MSIWESTIVASQQQSLRLFSDHYNMIQQLERLYALCIDLDYFIPNITEDRTQLLLSLIHI